MVTRDEDGHQHLIHDRDKIFARHLDRSLVALGLTVLRVRRPCKLTPWTTPGIDPPIEEGHSMDGVVQALPVIETTGRQVMQTPEDVARMLRLKAGTDGANAFDVTLAVLVQRTSCKRVRPVHDERSPRARRCAPC
jgi:hypothetical protein